MFALATAPGPEGSQASHGFVGWVAVGAGRDAEVVGLGAADGSIDGESVGSSEASATGATTCGAAPPRISESGA